MFTRVGTYSMARVVVKADNLECRRSLCTCGFDTDSGDPNPSQRLTWQTLYPLNHLSRPRISCWNHLCPALRDSILYKNPLFKDCALHCEIPFHKQHLTPSRGWRLTLHLSGHINNTICLGPLAGHKVKNNTLLKIERAPLCELVKKNGTVEANGYIKNHISGWQDGSTGKVLAAKTNGLNWSPKPIW